MKPGAKSYSVMCLGTFSGPSRKESQGKLHPPLEKDSSKQYFFPPDVQRRTCRWELVCKSLFYSGHSLRGSLKDHVIDRTDVPEKTLYVLLFMAEDLAMGFSVKKTGCCSLDLVGLMNSLL